MVVFVNKLPTMQELSEKSLLEALNAEDGKWQWMPFPEDKIPPGHKVRSVQGVVKGVTFLTVEFLVPEEPEAPRYDGTCVLPPVTFAHLPPEVAKAAFLKGAAWLDKHK